MSVFVEVARCKSFAAAAKSLDITGTMVANHVRALEKRMRAPLIERTTRSQRLTDVGVAYLERCCDVLDRVASADRVAEEVVLEPRGVLRVTAPVTWGAHLLVPTLAAYLERHPHVRIELCLDDGVIDLEKEKFDCGIRSGAISDDRLVARRLEDARVIAAASPIYLGRRGEPRTPEDLKSHVLVPFAGWGATHKWRFTKNDKRVDIAVGNRVVINNGQALLAAACAGIGIIVQAEILIAPKIATGELKQVLPDWNLPRRTMHIVRQADARPSAKLRAFVDHVVSTLA